MTIKLQTNSTQLAYELKQTQPPGAEVTLDPTLGMRTANTASGGIWTVVEIVASVPASVLAAWLAAKIIKNGAKGTKINRKELHFDSEDNLRSAIEECITADGRLTRQDSIANDDPLQRELSFRRWQMQHESDLAEYNADNQRFSDAFRSGNASGREAIRAVMLLNGGGAVAMLAFIGHLAAIGSGPKVIMEFAYPLAWFVWGAALSVLSSGMTYFSQRANSAWLDKNVRRRSAKKRNEDDKALLLEKAEQKCHVITRVFIWLAILTALAGLVCFAYGCFLGYGGFKSLSVDRYPLM